jgi:hypothetical protein
LTCFSPSKYCSKSRFLEGNQLSLGRGVGGASDWQIPGQYLINIIICVDIGIATCRKPKITHVSIGIYKL